MQETETALNKTTSSNAVAELVLIKARIVQVARKVIRVISVYRIHVSRLDQGKIVQATEFVKLVMDPPHAFVKNLIPVSTAMAAWRGTK